jgi:metal-responsive CopG/Arc/MetJ family transcriptional regulator
MKTAVSIPDEVFAEAERLAKRMKRSRSEIFSRALAEYIARHTPDRVTEAMNRTLAEVNELPDPFTAAASTRLLSRTEW